MTAVVERPPTVDHPEPRPDTGRLLAGGLGRWLVQLATIVFFGVPVVWLLLATTKSSRQIRQESPLSFGSFQSIGRAWNNLQTFQDGIILRWIWNSAWYTVVSVGLMLLISIPAGFALAKFTFRGRTALLFLTLIAMLVPSAALILPLYLEFNAVGLTDTAWSVILPLTLYPFGVYLVYLYAAANLPDSLIEAARMDGCSSFGVLVRIFLPLAKPAIALVSFFGFVNAWNNFFLPYLMLRTPSTFTLQNGLSLLVGSTNALTGAGNFNNSPIREPEVAMAAVVSVAPILLIFLFAQRYLVAGQLVAAEKG